MIFLFGTIVVILLLYDVQTAFHLVTSASTFPNISCIIGVVFQHHVSEMMTALQDVHVMVVFVCVVWTAFVTDTTNQCVALMEYYMTAIVNYTG